MSSAVSGAVRYVQKKLLNIAAGILLTRVIATATFVRLLTDSRVPQ